MSSLTQTTDGTCDTIWKPLKTGKYLALYSCNSAIQHQVEQASEKVLEDLEPLAVMSGESLQLYKASVYKESGDCFFECPNLMKKLQGI